MICYNIGGDWNILYPFVEMNWRNLLKEENTLRIAIAGGTGFVGKSLSSRLLELGHQVFILTRHAQQNKAQDGLSYIRWLSSDADPARELQEVDVMINLAGESINGGRWTDRQKERIIESRLQATDQVLHILRKLEKKPKVLINASAIGVYGTSETGMFTEDTQASGNDFLATTVQQWEEKALQATSLGIRTVLCRFGIILDAKKGALPSIALPYTLFAGGTVGSGKQWVSWIHIEDVIEAIVFIIEHDEIKGPVNFTAPTPVQMKQFGQTLGAVLNRPHWMPVPSFALQLALGEMSLLVLKGQNVHPNQLIQSGYQFRYPKLEGALQNIYQK